MQNLNNSRTLDVHVWSDHIEINSLVDELWSRYWNDEDSQLKRRGPKPKAPKKKHLKVLLLDLYVCWQSDPTMYLAVHMSKSGWKANSRYSALNLSSKMIDIIKRLVELDYLTFAKGFEGRLSRIAPTRKLIILFEETTLKLEDVHYHKDQETIILKAGDDLESFEKGDLLEYIDTPETLRMRSILDQYNKLLKLSHLDICSIEKPYVDRLITKGERSGETVRVHIDSRNVFVKRVFNDNSWERGGRFYGGWWQSINRELRSDIMINGKPTVEVDYKAMHIALLFSEIGYQHEYDPYTLDTSVFPSRNDFDQRQATKEIVLMALNAKSKTKAFRAFRSDQATGHSFKKLKNTQLEKLLNAFTNKYPEVAPYLCTGKGLELMYRDSCIAEYVIDHFTKLDVPVLCMHDSFIVPYDQVLELRTTMTEAGNKFARRFMFTDKKGDGLDEWQQDHLNSGRQPDWEPKQVRNCDGYVQRWNEYKLKHGVTPLLQRP